MDPKVLYVDDEQDLLELVASFFQEEGIEIDVSTNCEDALELIRTKNYYIIISDVSMPSGTGHDLYDTVTDERLFHGKFILLSGDPGEEELLARYDKVLSKPIDFQNLVNVVKSFLSH